MKKNIPSIEKPSAPLAAILVPLAVVGLVVLYLGAMAVPASEGSGEMHLSDFGAIPVMDGGRVKPVDTYARTSLMVINNRQSYTDDSDRTHQAIEWMLDLLSHGLANYYNQVPVRDRELREWLKLPDTPPNRAQYVYSLREIRDGFRAKAQELERIMKMKDDQRNEVEQQVFHLAVLAATRTRWVEEIAANLKKRGDPNQAKVFRIENDQLLNMLGLKPRSGLRYSAAEISENELNFRDFLRLVARAKERDEKALSLLDVKALELYRHLQIHFQLAQLDGVLMVPVPGSRFGWETMVDVLHDGSTLTNAQARSMEDILRAYATGDVQTFNKEVDAYRATMAKAFPAEARAAGVEVWYNGFAPFYQCTILYVLVLVLAPLSWLVWHEPLRRAAFGVAVVSLLLHTVAILIRMWLQGRPPVTNLYSSAVFIGWAAVPLCLALELIFRRGIGLFVAGVIGFPTLMISHHLALSGDTLEMMQAVLDTNFWLATHVVAVTLGYTATFVAGFLGMVYVGMAVISWIGQRYGGGSELLDRETSKTLGYMIYGVVCFATLLSFVGTVLGGIWADQSWGRFWGWDPKENGAVLIVIMNALILHARWGGMVKERGMAMLAICGNIVTMWSWFGTNQLGIGLHAYGFNKALVLLCTCFWISQALFLIAGGVVFHLAKPPALRPPEERPAPRPKGAPRPGAAGSTGVVPAS